MPPDQQLAELDSGLRARDIESALKTLRTEIEGLETVSTALGDGLGALVSSAVEIMARAAGRVVVTGIGKSGHVARKIAATLASTGSPSMYIHPAEASHGDLGMVRAEDVVLALSWSGETTELSDIMGYTRRFGIPLIAITSRADSTLGRAADVALAMPVLPEACPNGLAPTTSTTAQIAMGDALAICLLSRRGFTSEDFRDYHPGGKLGARLRRVRDLMHGGELVPLVDDTSTLSRAIVEMTSGRFGLTGVADADGRLIGVLTDGDLRRAFKGGFTDGPVTEVMNRTPRVIRPDALAAEALARMQRESITSLLAVEDDRAVGVIHIHDLLRAGVI